MTASISTRQGPGARRLRRPALLLCTCVAAAVWPCSAAPRNLHRGYRLHSRFWLPYEQDEKTIGLFHLDRTDTSKLEDLIEDLDPSTAAGGTGEKGSLNLLENAEPEEEEGKGVRVPDSSILKRTAWLNGQAQWVSEGRFRGGLRLGAGVELVTGPHADIGRGRTFTAECWVHPEVAGPATLISCDSLATDPSFVMRLRPDGRLYLACGGMDAATSRATLNPGTWTHVALMAAPAREVPGKYRYLPIRVGPQLMLHVNGVQDTVFEHERVGRYLQGMSGTIRFGLGKEDGSPGIRVDELRISSELRAFYARDVSWTDPLAAREIPEAPPFFRDRRDLTFSATCDGSFHRALGLTADGDPRFLAGVRGQALLAGGAGPAPTFTATNVVTADEGTVELWFSPYDWDNRRAQTFHDPMEFVPLLHVRSSDEKAKKAFLVLTVHHKMPLDRPRPPVVHPGQWYHVVGTWKGTARQLYLNGESFPATLGHLTVVPDQAPAVISLDPRSPRLNYAGVRTLIDEVRFYSRALTPEEIGNAYARWSPHRAVEPLPFAHVDWAMNHAFGTVRATAELLGPDRQAVERVRFGLYGPGAERPLFGTVDMAVTNGWASLNREDVDVGYGLYRAELAFLDHNGRDVRRQTVEKDRKRPPWLGSDVGTHDGEVLPGWDPIEVVPATPASGEATGVIRLKVIGREIGIGSSGWPASLVSAGADMLAAPIRVVAAAGGTTVDWAPSGSGPRVESAASDEVLTSGLLTGDGWRLATRITTEFDGLMRVAATLSAEGDAALDALRVEIPIRTEHARFCGFWTGLRNFRAGADYRLLPDRDGVLFTSVKPTRARLKELRGSFIPYLHLGDDERVLCWFAENDKGWTKSEETAAVDVVRGGKVTTLRLNLLSETTSLADPRTFVFGLQLAPVKPLPQHHRTFTKYLNFAFVDSFSKQHLKTDGTWGSFQIYPEHYDWGAAEARAKVHELSYRYMAGYEKPVLYIDRNWVGLPPDAREFSPLWWASGFFRYLPEARDCYAWNINEWLRHGLIAGIYIDDSWIGTFRNLRSGLAYELPDGTVQPGFEFFDYHEMLKRLRWLFHDNDMDPLIWMHMTMTYLLPNLSFADAVLDGEDRFLAWGDKRDFIAMWGFARLRHNNGRKWGLMPVWMNKIGADKPKTVAMPHWEYRQNRSYHAGLAVHDIRNTGGWLKDLEEAGCYEDDAEFIGYWQPECPVRSVTEHAVASVYRRGRRAAVVVADGLRTNEARVIELAVRPDALGWRASSLRDILVADADTYDPPEGEDITRIKIPKQPSGGMEAEPREGELLDDLMAELEEEEKRDPDAFRFDNHNFQIEENTIRLRVRPHDYRLLVLRPR